MTDTNTFTHRQKIIRWTGPIRVCADCGAPAQMELLNVTVYSDHMPTLMEQPSNKCPNGPHLVEARND